MLAKNNASLDGMGPNDFSGVPQARQYVITYTNGYREIVIAIQCPTLPVAYLCRGNSDTKIKIMIRINKFLSEPYEFSSKIITNATRTYFFGRLILNTDKTLYK